MRPRILILALLSAFAFVALTLAPAEARVRTSARPGHLFAGDVVPPEWAGIWTFTDSTYDCTGKVMSTDAGVDTLCAGQPILVDEGGPYALNCNGTATATTADVTCSYLGEIFTDCFVTASIEFHAVRTGESYVATGITSQQYDGTGEGCDFFPDSCTRTVTYGTRTGPAPAEYCATPAAPMTWGRVKVRYR